MAGFPRWAAIAMAIGGLSTAVPAATQADANPRHVYHDALIALAETRGINNGQPSLWARLFDELNLCPGAAVVHVGAGAGYYSAILAEIVGPTGRVTAIEIDPQLASIGAQKQHRLAHSSEPTSFVYL